MMPNLHDVLKIKIRQKLLLFAFLILAGNLFIGYQVHQSNQKLLDSNQLVQHKEQVIRLVDNIFSLGKDIETSARGFVITKDSTYLEPFYAADKIIFTCLAQLRQLIQDDSLQLTRVDSLNFFMHKRLDFSSNMIELRSKWGLAVAIAYTSTKQGKVYFDRISEIISDIKEDESNFLSQVKQKNDWSIAGSSRFSTIIFILMAMFTILLLIATGKYLVQNREKEKRGAELAVAYKILKKAQDDIRKLNEELEEKVVERTEQLKSVNKELEAFSYSVSHDLRAPLRAVHGYAQILKEDYGAHLDPEATRVMNNIMKSAKKMGELIDDLLAFSRLGRKELVKRDIRMNDMVTNICRQIKSENENRDIQFEVTDLQPAQGDSTVIKQVWVNLISNAIKYTAKKEKAIIKIGSLVKGDEIIYHIKDNGAGFDMRYADKLFGVFQRLHSEDDFEGTGVGLAIVHRIISKHGGKIWAEGKVNEGAGFHFSLIKVHYNGTPN